MAGIVAGINAGIMVGMTRSSLWLPVLAAASAAIVVAVLGATMTELGPWYQSLQKPTWQPPDWLFAPAWTIIFALAAISGVTAWRHAPSDESRDWIIGLFALNGFLNVLWSALFFRLHRPDWALFEVAFLWLSVFALIVAFWRYARPASLLLLPYLAWVTFAAILNLAIVRLNAPFTGG
jgi:tryptophan-rich sensory protein